MELVIQFALNSLIAGAIYTIIALGFNLTYSTAKFFNLAHGVMTAIGGYVVFFFFQQLDLHITPSIIIGIFAAGIIGYLIDKVAYLPLRRRKASSTVLLVASLGVLSVLQAVLAIIFESQFHPLRGNLGIKTFEIFGGAITNLQIIILAVSVVVTILLALFIKKTLFGKSVRAVSDDEEVAKIVGIRTDRIIGYVMGISAALAGLAGILIGLDTGIEPTMGMNLLLKGIVASVIGGVGSLWGSVVGSFVLGFAENFGIWKISGEWKDAIAFGLLIIFLLFRPQGIIKK